MEGSLANVTAVIQAGGLGSRMLELTKDNIPKPLLELNGKPMIQWQIENLAKYDIKNIVIITGHLGEKIESYFGDGSALDVHISYIREESPLGSAGALYFIKDMVADKDFFLIFGDVMFDVDMMRMMNFHRRKGALATLAVHPNSHPQDSDLVEADADGCIIGFFSKKEKRMNWHANLVNAGLYIMSGTLLESIDMPKRMDLEKELLFPIIKDGNIYGYRTTEYIKDAGTPERFREVGMEKLKGLWDSKNLENKQKCIFIDRDGTLNVYKGLLADEDELELEKYVSEALQFINKSGYLAIMVTNQPVVARGMCSLEDVNRIHHKMETLLGEQGAYLDDIVFCPHHPDKGYPEEVPEYKIDCDCRKPKIGMLAEMAEKYNIDLSESYMIGDSTTDIKTGKNAGCKTVLLHTGNAGTDGKYSLSADYEAENLLDAVKYILDGR